MIHLLSRPLKRRSTPSWLSRSLSQFKHVLTIAVKNPLMIFTAQAFHIIACAVLWCIRSPSTVEETILTADTLWAEQEMVEDFLEQDNI